MSGKSHRVSVVPARGGRKYVWRCSCGVSGWETSSSSQAQRQGEQHKATTRR
ncbi:hypothetical protein [Streptomyces gibsoniae]|uniref:Uncharacterized protein n=1 Tax=Streptomyces gibsoniae TaxID=3075529 RepID=A0ABU2TWK9_9ACTN|nr:hypothetical protein [Streptomyces sp. DSM 41699]MDT0465352.1 hypothetical protein [Streptomyces sp. DSM 41699]